MAGLFAVVSASAQYSRYANSTVTVNLNGNTNDQVYIDGRNYSAYNNTLQLNNLQPGIHTIQVRTNNNRSFLGGLFGGGRNMATTDFEVRDGYDTQLNVRANGRVQVRESRSTAYRSYRRDRYNRYDNYR